MNSSAEKIIPMHKKAELLVQQGSVASVAGDDIVILVSGVQKRAQKAFSCLVVPEKGDRLTESRVTEVCVTFGPMVSTPF